jgi:hypothetical protein
MPQGGSFLDKLLLGIKAVWWNGAPTTIRSTVNFLGGTVADNPSLGTTDVSLSGVLGGGWQTALDLDLSAQPNQTLGTDTTFTIGGLTWTKQNSSSDATAMAVVNGTGLVVSPIASTDYRTSGRTSPVLLLPLSSILTPAWGMRLRVYVSVGASEVLPSGSDTFMFVGIDTGNTNLMMSAARGQRNGVGGFDLAIGCVTATALLQGLGRQPSGLYVPGVADQTFVWETDSLGLPPYRVYFAPGIAVGAVFPNLTTYRSAGVVSPSVSVQTATGTQHVPADLFLVLGSARAGGGSPVTTPFQRIRVDFNTG